ncbi:hypothetical protein [Piscinibacter sakaiensis]|uniref:hypothetical protein n=1 Tax=Piscinibacter sakaiensis TaxID=1547922 RepID=UPI003AAE8D19
MQVCRSIGISSVVVVSALYVAVAPAASDGSVAAAFVPGPLDGKTFRGALGPDGKPKDTPDVFVFENGTFVSKECELRCKYPARPYFVRGDGDRMEFISETRCPYKDARITWRGTVEGDRIRGKSTWVVKRWYWNVENTFEFEGRLVPADTSSAAID